MEEGWKHYTGAAPVFEQGTNFTKVEFWLSAKEIQGGQKGGQTEPLTNRQEEVFSLLKNRNTIGRKEIAERLHINESAVQKLLDALKDKGYIQREGMKGGYWKILKK
ncbi:LexA family transcriptional regulator [Olivibacter sp. XZL3]|uniref:LexA family protein n=1 Tax=Olivibacter sp. XZL3 TaxID=1735116 RepID=UPI001066F160|nr:MarR family transcriptional regulator [Olivibacter sp. XZL3]